MYAESPSRQPAADFLLSAVGEGGLVRLESDLSAVIGARTYIVLATAMKSPVNHDALGLYHPSLSHWLRKEIGDREDIAGPTIWLNDVSMATLVHEHPATLLRTCAAHEVAHAVDQGWYSSGDELPHREAFAAYVAMAPADIEALKTRQQQQQNQHGPHFLRVLFHVAHRLIAKGWSIDYGLLHHWEFYRLSLWRVSLLRDAIETELTWLANVSLCDLRSIEPPDGWNELATPAV